MDKPQKSPDAYRTISEVSDQLDVPQHVLRFWETKFPQVAPMKRAGNRRYYDPAHIELLARIRDLLYVEGYTTKGVQKLLEEGRLMEGASSGGASLSKGPSASLMDITADMHQTGQQNQGAGAAAQGQHALATAPAPSAHVDLGMIAREALGTIGARLKSARDRLAIALDS